MSVGRGTNDSSRSLIRTRPPSAAAGVRILRTWKTKHAVEDPYA